MNCQKYLRLKKHIYVKELKHGELFLLDITTGVWIKTSISFRELYKVLKKGVTVEELENVCIKCFPGREGEAKAVIDSLKVNGFFEGYHIKFELVSVDKMKKVTFLCPISINKNKLLKFLERNFKDFQVEIILEGSSGDSITNLNPVITKALCKSSNGEENLKVIIRTDWNQINEKLKDLDIHNIQVNFSFFEKDSNKINEKIKILEELKKEKNLELRYSIATFRKKIKRMFYLLLLLFPIPLIILLRKIFSGYQKRIATGISSFF